MRQPHAQSLSSIIASSFRFARVRPLWLEIARRLWMFGVPLGGDMKEDFRN
jgi:hypothetical protein